MHNELDPYEAPADNGKPKTRQEINTALRMRGDPIAYIKAWRAEKVEAGEPASFDDFYRAHGACLKCAGAIALFIRVIDGRVLKEPCPVCEAR